MSTSSQGPQPCAQYGAAGGAAAAMSAALSGQQPAAHTDERRSSVKRPREEEQQPACSTPLTLPVHSGQPGLAPAEGSRGAGAHPDQAQHNGQPQRSAKAQRVTSDGAAPAAAQQHSMHPTPPPQQQQQGSICEASGAERPAGDDAGTPAEQAEHGSASEGDSDEGEDCGLPEDAEDPAEDADCPLLAMSEAPALLVA